MGCKGDNGNGKGGGSRIYVTSAREGGVGVRVGGALAAGDQNVRLLAIRF